MYFVELKKERNAMLHVHCVHISNMLDKQPGMLELFERHCCYTIYNEKYLSQQQSSYIVGVLINLEGMETRRVTSSDR
jgi:hypothetical protein